MRPICLTVFNTLCQGNTASIKHLIDEKPKYHTRTWETQVTITTLKLCECLGSVTGRSTLLAY